MLELLAPWLFSAALGSETEGLRVRVIEHKGDRYHVVTVDLTQHRLDLFGQGTRGHPRTIGALDTALERHGLERVAATNAGIFQPGQIPGGLHIEEGKEQHALNLRDGQGNFHLMPNAAFACDAALARRGRAAPSGAARPVVWRNVPLGGSHRGSQLHRRVSGGCPDGAWQGVRPGTLSVHR